MRLESFGSDLEDIRKNETNEITSRNDKEGLLNINEKQYNHSIFRLAWVKVSRPAIFNQELIKECERFKKLKIAYTEEKMIEDISKIAQKLEFIATIMEEDAIDRIIDDEEIEQLKVQANNNFDNSTNGITGNFRK